MFFLNCFFSGFRNHPGMLQNKSKTIVNDETKMSKKVYTGVIQFFFEIPRWCRKASQKYKIFCIFSWSLSFFQHTGVTKIYHFFAILYRGHLEKQGKKWNKWTLFRILVRKNEKKNNLGHECIFTYTLVIWSKNAKKNAFFRLILLWKNRYTLLKRAFANFWDTS